MNMKLINAMTKPSAWAKHRRHTCVVITAEIGGNRYLYVKGYACPAIGAWYIHQAHKMLDAGKLPHSTVTVLHKAPAQLVITLQRDYQAHYKFYSLSEYRKALQTRLTGLESRVYDDPAV